MVLMNFFIPGAPGSLSFQLWLCLAVVLLHGGFVHGQRNISVTQDSTSIVYRGEWRSVNDTRSIGGVHRLAAGAGASAEYSFTGTAFYFSSAKWPYPIRSNVSMDGRAGIILDLQDHDGPELPRNSSATKGAAIQERGVWSNLANGRHTVRVTVPVGDQSAIVDGFIITLPVEGAVGTTTGSTTTGTTTTDTTTSTDTTPTPEPDPTETTTGEPEWDTVTSTYTTIEDLGLETQTVIVIEVPATSTGTADASNSDGSSSSPSGGGFNKGLAIGFGVAFGVILIILLIGVIFWIRRRDRLFQERDAGAETTAGVLPPPPTRQAQGPASTFGGSVRGAGYEQGTIGSGTATPLPQNNMAGVGSGPIRESGRRHSYDGTFLMPHTQPEPWAESFVPVAGRAG